VLNGLLQKITIKFIEENYFSLSKRRSKMIIICFSDYPVQSGKEVTKRFLEVPRLPEYIKGKGNYVYSTTGAGYHNISILEVDDAKAGEAFDAITKAYLNFIDIPGYSYDIRICYKVSEAIKLMG
jgi:uncharacterized protein with GYD domain